ncbi:hypothetical protein CYMTET_32834, partial [Cymbomonas tetramitiformis]
TTQGSAAATAVLTASSPPPRSLSPPPLTTTQGSAAATSDLSAPPSADVTVTTVSSTITFASLDIAAFHDDSTFDQIFRASFVRQVAGAALSCALARQPLAAGLEQGGAVVMAKGGCGDGKREGRGNARRGESSSSAVVEAEGVLKRACLTGAAGAPSSSVAIDSISAGSVAVHSSVTFQSSTTGDAASAARSFSAALLSAPADIFADFGSTYGSIEASEVVTMTHDSPATPSQSDPPPSGLDTPAAAQTSQVAEGTPSAPLQADLALQSSETARADDAVPPEVLQAGNEDSVASSSTPPGSSQNPLSATMIITLAMVCLVISLAAALLFCHKRHSADADAAEESMLKTLEPRHAVAGVWDMQAQRPSSPIKPPAKSKTINGTAFHASKQPASRDSTPSPRPYKVDIVQPFSMSDDAV